MDNQPVVDGRRQRAVVFAAIGLLLLITVPLANILNIWIDEGYTLHTTSGSLASTIKSAREFEMQPAVYFAELWAWRQMSDSITLARLNSVFAAAAAVWFVYLAARRWLKGVPPAYAAALYAINAYVLWAAVEIRPYSLVQVCCALLLVLFYDGFYQEKPKRSARILYALVALTSLYIYYFLGFMLVAMTAPLLVEQRWKRLAVYVAWMAGVGVLFLPEVLFVANHVETVVAIKGAQTSIMRATEYVAGHVFSLPFGLPPLPKLVRWTIGLSMAIVTASSLVLLRKRISPETRALWAGLVALGVCYGVVVRSVMREDDLTQRHLMIMIIPSMLALLSVVGMYTARTWRVAMLGFAALWVAFNGYAAWWMFHPMAKQGDYKRVAKYLEEHQEPGEPVAVATSHAALPFRAYYRGTGEIYPLPFEDTYDQYVIERWRFESPEHVRACLRPAISQDGTLWLFTDRGEEAEYFGVSLNFAFLEQVLREDFDLVSEKDFFNAKVREFQLKPHVQTPAEMTSTPASTPSAAEVTASTAREGAQGLPPSRRGPPPPRDNGAANGVFGAPSGGGGLPGPGPGGRNR